MGLGSVLSVALKGKIVATVLVGTALVGGATAMAATPLGQNIVHQITDSRTATPTTHDKDQKDKEGKGTPTADKDGKGTPTAEKDDHGKACPGSPDAQRLAKEFSLSTDSKSAGMQAICSLHDGTFKGTTTSGTAVASHRVLGFGEIDQLLTLAQFLASHNKANASGKLTDSNVSSFLANALQTCGTDPLMVCLKKNIPGFEPGQSGDNGHANATPTPNGHKPDGTPPPNGGKPDGTPTPPPHP